MYETEAHTVDELVADYNEHFGGCEAVKTANGLAVIVREESELNNIMPSEGYEIASVEMGDSTYLLLADGSEEYLTDFRAVVRICATE